MTSVLISLLPTLRGLVRSRAALLSRSWRCAISCRCFNGRVRDGCGSRAQTVGSGRGCRARGARGEPRSSSSNRKPSSPGIVRASACSGHGTVDAASGGRRSERSPCVDSKHVGDQALVGRTTASRRVVETGLDVSLATVAKYMVRGTKPPSQTWRTFSRITSSKSRPPTSSSCQPPSARGLRCVLRAYVEYYNDVSYCPTSLCA
jgi:hypothetical protein